MDFLDLFGISVSALDTINNIQDLIPSVPRRKDSIKRRKSSFIEEKRGYRKSGDKNDQAPQFDICPEAQEIRKLLGTNASRYYNLINLYSIVLCQLLSSTTDFEDEDKHDKERIHQLMIDQRINDLQNLGAKFEDDNVVSAETKDMSLFLSLANNLFSQELTRLKNDREIYYYVKEDIQKEHDKFMINFFDQLKKY